MVKLRNRILHTLLLAALSLTMLGSTAEAARRSSRTSQPTPPRPIARPLAGEPDLTGQTAPAPPKITGTSMQAPPAGEAIETFRVWTRYWLSQYLKRRL